MTIPDIQKKPEIILAELVRIASEGFIPGTNIQELLHRIRNELGIVIEGSTNETLGKGIEIPGNEWSHVLYPSQYVLPPELRDISPRIIDQLQSSNGNQHFTNSGLLLYGVPGTGKSEYISYLKGVLGDKVIFYSANIAAIRNAPDPSVQLDRLYDYLQMSAGTSGKYVVVLIDEMDIFMQEFSSVKRTRNTRENFRETHGSTDTTEVFESTVDPIGSQLFSTLKTLMQGSGKCPRVFTIGTTNLLSIPDALSRDGRFNAVGLPLPFKDFTRFNSGSNNEDRDFLRFFDYIIFTLQIFSATYCRLHNLQTEPTIFGELLKEASKLRKKYVGLKPKGEVFGMPRCFDKNQKQDLRKAICDFLGVPESSRFRRNFITSLEPIGFSSFKFSNKEITGLTQSSLAGIFKDHSTIGSDEIKGLLRIVFRIED